MATRKTKKNKMNPYLLVNLDCAWEEFNRTGNVSEKYWDAVTAAYCISIDAKYKKKANKMYKWIQRQINF